MLKDDKYQAVDPDFTDIVKKICKTKSTVKTFYFDLNKKVEVTEGTCLEIIKNETGEFLSYMDDNVPVRLDRIIAIKGKPGPAYHDYEQIANDAHTCLTGNEKNRHT